MHFLSFYEVSATYLARRREFREEHLKLAREAQKPCDRPLTGGEHNEFIAPKAQHALTGKSKMGAASKE